MTNKQRMENDIATMNRRDMEDQTTNDSRNRNDELTMDRRDRADKEVEANRLRNDEMTANRRETKDGTFGMALTVFLLVLLGSGVGAFFTFI